LGDPEVKAKLRRAICRFPSEWDKGSTAARYGFVKDLEPFKESPDAWPRLEAHLKAISFDGLPQAFLGADWRGHPREFIEQSRKCGWLNVVELVQFLPGNQSVGFSGMQRRLTVGFSNGAQRLPAKMTSALNTVLRKYRIESPLRRAHFWGQIAQETDQLQTVREYASGSAYEGRADLGNVVAGDGTRFRGRGVIQLTGRSNYMRYGQYRGANFTSDPNSLLLESDAYAACDASTFYWVSENTRDRINNRWRLDGWVGINRRADACTFATISDPVRVRADVSSVTRQINRAELHLDNRITYFKYAYINASDITETMQYGNLRPQPSNPISRNLALRIG
jgi:hydroxyethylthiazole kinase